MLIKNPKHYTNEDTRGIHLKVSNVMYERLTRMIEEGIIKNRTDYIRKLIEQDDEYKRG